MRTPTDIEKDLKAFALLLEAARQHPEGWHPDDVQFALDMFRAAAVSLQIALEEEEWLVRNAVRDVLQRCQSHHG